jgi:hypothetical protein
MRKSIVKQEKFSPVGINSSSPKTSPNYTSSLLYGLVILFILVFTLAGLLIWNIVVTQQLNSSAKSSYNPVIYKVLTSSSVSLQGSTLNNPSSALVYQYVGLQKGTLPLIDSLETPHTTLPIFSPFLTFVAFPNGVLIENGDVITHGFYSVSNVDDAINPLAAVYFVYYESCFQDINGTNVCWTGSNYCNYPFTTASNQVTITNLAEALAYGQQYVDSNVGINPSNGCLYVTIDKDLVNDQIVTQLTQNLSTVDISFADAFTLQVDTQIGDRTLTLCTVNYTVALDFTTIDPADAYYDFYITYGDGSPFEHHVGVFGTSNPITHTYATDAPTLVLVKIAGYLPAWSCTALSFSITTTAMTKDVISWGNVSLGYVDFYPETNLVAISAGPPPPTVKGMCYFFPPNANVNIWANLNTWNVDNIEIGISMFRVKSLGILDLRGWRLPRLRYATEMFLQVAIPIIGNLTDMTFESVEYAQFMFAGFTGGPIDLSNANMSSLIIARGMFDSFDSVEFDVSRFYTPNLRIAENMFKQTDKFPNLNVTFWTTTSLQDITRMFFGCNGIQPIFTNWNMQNITLCRQFIQSSNDVTLRQISSSANYNQILIDFYSKTNSTGLICNWGLTGFETPLRINGNASSLAGFTARTNLINRGWTIVDLYP